MCRAPRPAEAIAEVIAMPIDSAPGSLASIAAALASVAIESTIDSGLRLLRDFIEKTSGA